MSILTLILKQVNLELNIEQTQEHIFLMISQILNAYNKFSDGVLSTKNPETFLNFLFRVSFFLGIYGLFVIFNVRVEKKKLLN